MFETELAALEALFGAIVELPGTIASAIVSSVYLLLYPFVLVFNLLWSWIKDVIVAYVGIITAITDAVDAVWSIADSVYGLVLPSAWWALFAVILGINVGFRVYHFVKHLSIAGFSL